MDGGIKQVVTLPVLLIEALPTSPPVWPVITLRAGMSSIVATCRPGCPQEARLPPRATLSIPLTAQLTRGPATWTLKTTKAEASHRPCG
jgi:hypothetical protein